MLYTREFFELAKSRLNPVLIAVSILVLLLTLTATSYETYFAGAQFVHFLLGPATVALAIPLYTQFRRVRSMVQRTCEDWKGMKLSTAVRKYSRPSCHWRLADSRQLILSPRPGTGVGLPSGGAGGSTSGRQIRPRP